MTKFFKDLVTQADGESYCFMRVLTILGALACIVYLVVKGVSSIQEWAQAYAIVTGGGSLGTWAKSKAEPEQ